MKKKTSDTKKKMMLELYDIIFRVLTLMILLTSLVGGWVLFYLWYKDYTGFNDHIVNLDTEENLREINKEFKAELVPIREELILIKKILLDDEKEHSKN